MGWKEYWKKKNHKRKGLCCDYSSINSLCMFNKRLETKKDFSIDDKYKVKATFKGDGFQVKCVHCDYFIPVEKQLCNGCHFFRCPVRTCNRKMRILYYCRGIFACRKCLNLGYYSQILSPSDRKPPFFEY